jgi:protein disulfide-isomerase A1
MKAIILILLSLFILNICNEEFPFDKDVIVLTDSTFDKAVEKYEYLLVYFYAPWCIRCNKFHPEYEKAASVLRKENLFLAKVDATVEKKLDKRFQLTGFPVVKLFIKGKEIEYNKERKSADLINWMRRKTKGPSTLNLDTKEDIEKFRNENDVVLIYYGDNKLEIEEYIKVARKNDDFQFGVVKSNDLIKKYSQKSTIVLYKKYDEKERELKDIKEKNIEEFINKYSSPKLMKFDEKAANMIFEKNQSALILFTDEKSKKWADYEKLMKKISDKLNYKLKIIITDIKDVLSAKLAETIGLKENNLPTIRIIDKTGKYTKKYKMEEDINEKNILKFVDNWENKKIKSYVKSGEIPKDNNEDVFIIVGNTFEKEVLNNKKDVMVLLYSPLCYHCKALLPEYEKVAKRLKDKNKNLLLTKINAIENEIESIDDYGFPKIKFYPGNKKDKPPIDYNGDKSVEDIIKFIQKNADNPIIIDNGINSEL